jgi:hypothetical protein
MTIYTPYTYLIGWSQHKKFYYGVRFAACCNPKDLWVKYFTSSKHVKKFREKHGEPDIVQIRKTFQNATQAKTWEEKVLRRMNVILDERFINKNVNGRFIKEGPQSKEHIEKRIKIGVKTRMKNGSYLVSSETKLKISASTKGVLKPFSEEHSNNIKFRMSVFNKKVICCPYCNKEGQYSNMKRWHFDNCKKNPSNNVKKKEVNCYKCGFVTHQSPNFYKLHNNNCIHVHSDS